MKNAKLTPSEKKVLQQLVQGKSNQEIANHLELSINTVKTHLKRIFKKKNVKSRVKLIVSNSHPPEQPSKE